MAMLNRGVINPVSDAAGISGFPLAGRLAAKMAAEEDFEDFLLVQARGTNGAGELGHNCGRHLADTRERIHFDSTWEETWHP